ncbi:MAG: hypothetical protein QM758_23565 [Armatimonas sp.]
MNSRHYTSCNVVVPRVKDATEYAVNCYGFNDTYYWGTHYGHTWTEPLTNYLPPKPAGIINGNYPEDSLTDTEIWDGISNSSGPADGAGEAFSTMDGRFKSMTVEVTVTLK